MKTLLFLLIVWQGEVNETTRYTVLTKTHSLNKCLAMANKANTITDTSAVCVMLGGGLSL